VILSLARHVEKGAYIEIFAAVYALG